MEEQLVTFSLGDEDYAVSIIQVKEIIQYKEATKLPNTPRFVEGIINLRGKIISVINLAMRLDLVDSKSTDKYALIIETAGREVGFVVDEVTEVIRLQASAIEPKPITISAEYIRGIGKGRNRLIILLDVDKLLSDEEINELKKAG